MTTNLRNTILAMTALGTLALAACATTEETGTESTPPATESAPAESTTPATDTSTTPTDTTTPTDSTTPTPTP